MENLLILSKKNKDINWKSIFIIVIEILVIISALFFVFNEWPEELGLSKLIEHITDSIFLLIIFVIFSFCLFLLFLRFMWEMHYTKALFGKTKDNWDDFIDSIIHALVAVIILLILSKSLIIFNSGYSKIDEKDTIIQIVGILLMFITILATVAYIWIGRVNKINNEIKGYMNELKNELGISTNIILKTLPPFGITIQIPNKSMKMLEEIDNLILQNPHLEDYIYDKKNIDVGPKIQYARALYKYGQLDLSCIDILESHVINKTIDRDVLFQAKIRLGIAYRQFGKYKKTYELFKELEEESRNYPYYNTYAKISMGFTKYTEYMEKIGFKNAIWGSQPDNLNINHEKIKPLIDAFNHFKSLWVERKYRQFNEIPYISDYLAKTAFDIKLYLDNNNNNLIPEEIKNINNLIKEVNKFTINRISLIVPSITRSSHWEINIVPFYEDYSFFADYYLSLAINCHFLIKLLEENKNNEKEKFKELRKIALKESLRYSKMVKEIYPPFDFITSEKQLKLVKSEDFIKELEQLIKNFGITFE